MNPFETQIKPEKETDSGSNPILGTSKKWFQLQKKTVKNQREFLIAYQDFYAWGVRIFFAVSALCLLLVSAIYYGFINP